MYPQYMFEFPNHDSSFPFYLKKKSYTAVSSHRHDFIEFSFVISGHGKEIINGSEHALVPGTTVLLLPYQIHEYYAISADNPLQMYICNFDMSLLTDGPESGWGLRDLLLGRNNAQSAFVHLEGEFYHEGQRVWDRIHKEYAGSMPWKHIMLKALLLEALTLFARSSGLSTGLPKQDDPPSQQRKGIWPIVHYVYEHYLEPLTLTSLSERFYLHPTQLSTMFGEEYGIHFVDFLHELRIRHACSLLIASDIPISQVAYESGFASYPTFSRAFLSIKGTTPRAYRERYK
jgi:AraC-like DNA-binding protein